MDPLSTIPQGPAAPPILLHYDSMLEFDVDDVVDGGLFMLDRELGGSLALPFTKPMDASVAGVVTVDDEPFEYVLRQVVFGKVQAWMLGVKVFGRLVSYGTQHTLHVEGFADADGNVMAPQHLTIRTRSSQQPQPEFAEQETIARRVAEEGIVLLENRESTLPLPPGQLNAFGHALHAFRTTVVGAGKINARYIGGLREAIREHAHLSLNEELAAFYQAGRDSSRPASAPATNTSLRTTPNRRTSATSRSSRSGLCESSTCGPSRSHCVRTPPRRS